MNLKKPSKLSESSVRLVFSRLLTSYVWMGLIGFFLCLMAGSYEKSFTVHMDYQWQLGVLILLLISGINAILIKIFEESFPTFRMWQMGLGKLVDCVPVTTVVYLSFIGALGEELLFRVGLQPYLGLVLSSILLSVCYLSREFQIFSLTGFAVVRSLLLGTVLYYMRDIYLVIVAHFVSNLLLFFRSRYGWAKALRGLS